MSAQHTKGQMTTDEADHCMPHENIWLMVGTRAVACVWMDDAPVPDYNREQQANARRLVACWNACEGISTEYLEGDDSLPHYARRLTAQCNELLTQRNESLPHYARRLMVQRDELLAALKLTTHCLQWHAERHPAGMDEKAVQDALATIAKVEQR